MQIKNITPEEKSILQLYELGWTFEEMISIMEVTRDDARSELIDNNIKIINKVRGEIEQLRKTRGIK